MRWVMRGLLLVVLSFANLNEIWSPDVVPNALLTWTLVNERDIDYDEFTFRPEPGSLCCLIDMGPGIDRESYFFRACGVSTATQPPKAARSIGGPPAPGPSDHVCSIFPPGIGLLAMPILAPLARYYSPNVPQLTVVIVAG